MTRAEWMEQAAQALYESQVAEFGEVVLKNRPEFIATLEGASEAFEAGQSPRDYIADYVGA